MSDDTMQLSELVTQRGEKIQQAKRADLPYLGLEHLATDSPDPIGTSPSSVSSSTNNVFYEGDVLFGKLRPYLRKSIRAPFSGYCSTDILVLRPAARHDEKFVAKVFQTKDVFRKAVATSIGTKMPRTSWQALREHRTFAPPLPEQRRIAEILDTVDEAIRKTEEVIAKLEQMKQGLLRDLLTRGIDENGELRDPERHPEQFKDSPLGRIPRGWKPTLLGDCLRASPQNGLYKRADQIGYGALIVGQTAFTPERSVDYGHARRATATSAELNKWGLEGGDILVSRVFATVEGVGQPVLVPSPPEPAVYESNMMRLKIDSEIIAPTLVFHWLRDPRCRAALTRCSDTQNLRDPA